MFRLKYSYVSKHAKGLYHCSFTSELVIAVFPIYIIIVWKYSKYL